jgi:DNA-binding NarL/FixJ family response regulator
MTPERIPIRGQVVDNSPMMRRMISCLLDVKPQMEMVGAVGSGHEALEAGKAKSSWVNTWKANMSQWKGAWEKPPLFLIGLLATADNDVEVVRSGWGK